MMGYLECAGLILLGPALLVAVFVVILQPWVPDLA